ncbi:hypothetical protein CEXT_783631 [Caerostris extrusa]|uniref:Uncharacterized protein n=1 Tax=Caerostris extrusa TaxID=172846 RepID=A0AAV4NYU7_CAEEX|nr:hypothetical protein CEXT_783631 [Caerostris extrusa]
MAHTAMISVYGFNLHNSATKRGDNIHGNPEFNVTRRVEQDEPLFGSFVINLMKYAWDRRGEGFNILSDLWRREDHCFWHYYTLVMAFNQLLHDLEGWLVIEMSNLLLTRSRNGDFACLDELNIHWHDVV